MARQSDRAGATRSHTRRRSRVGRVTALEQRELPDDEDPDALTFELNGSILAANTNFVLRGEPAALDMAKSVVRRRLGIAATVS